MRERPGESDRTITIREDLPQQGFLGYPCTVAVGAELLTVYYAQDSDGVTGIWASSWRRGGDRRE